MKIVRFAAAASALMLGSSAFAQTGDMVVMRRQIQTVKATGSAATTPTPTTAAGTPTPSAPAGYYNWQVSSWTQSGTCGATGTETRTVSCTSVDGGSFADALCTGNNSGQKPIASRPTQITATCSYRWTESAWSAPATTCGTSVISRDVSCLRSDGTVADRTLCTETTPPAQMVDTETSGCGYDWSADQWVVPASSTCEQVTETRNVYCLRTDGVHVADDRCTGTKPDASQGVYTCGAGAHWVSGGWGQASAGCGNSSAYRSVDCESASGQHLADAVCTDAKPPVTESAKDYSTCTDGRTAANPYGWTVGAYGAPSTTCGTATVTRPVTCTDDDGAAVDDAHCTSAKPAATGTQAMTSGCTFSWATGDFGPAQAACGDTVQTRAVTCTRSDSTPVAADSCRVQDEPSATQPAKDYSSCTFAWQAGDYSAPTTTCGDATQTRMVYCQRADGTTVDDAQCPTMGKPDAVQSSHQISGCGFSWNTGDYATTAACGATTATRTVTCLRSDGQTVDDGQCAVVGQKPPVSKDATDYSTCSYDWSTTDYVGPDTTCGTVTKTRSVVCQRSDGTTVDDSSCTKAKPPASETNTYTSGCTYAWYPEPYGAATPACGASTHSRTIDCRRSDGTILPASACAGVPDQPGTSEATTDYSTCTYKWSVSDWQGTAGCGDTVTQNRTVTCQRSDGSPVQDYYCSTPKPPVSQPITDYSQCSFSWKVTNGPWSSTCSTTATRSNTVVCMRSDGTQADTEASCTDPKPATTDTGNVAGCTYKGTYSAYSACTGTASSSSGTQTSTIQTCTRSDSTVVANSQCTPQTTTQTCAYTYTPAYSAYGACNSVDGTSNGAQTRTITSCTRDDGVASATSYCTDPAASASCTATAPAQLINNGNFTTDASFWTLSAGVARACVGSTTQTCFASTTTSGSTISQTTSFATVSGASYAFSMSFGNQSNTGNYVAFNWSIVDSTGKSLGSGAQSGSSSILATPTKLGTIVGNGNKVTLTITRTYGSGNTVAYGKFSLLKQ